MEDWVELGAARARFATVAARWALDANMAARLLGCDGDWTDRSLMALVGGLGAEGEARMRLVCDIDALVGRLVPEDGLVEWLRTDGVGYEDALVTPLEALSSGRPAMRALRRHLEELPADRAG